MSSIEQHHSTFNDDDFDDDDDNDNDNDNDNDSEPLNGAVPDIAGDSDSSSDSDDVDPPLPSSTSVTVAIPASISTPKSSTSVTVALPDPKRSPLLPLSDPRKPIDDSRRLFQRLWTDEDEIELLQGFLDYTSSRGLSASGHHHDTAAFYDQIKCKLQLDFNKNQLVEKLRRLKKKYRTVLSKINSGKDFAFKSPHDQITFEISSKIWSNLSTNHHRGGGGAAAGHVEFDDDDQNPNPNPNPNSSIVVATPPPPAGTGSGGGGGGYYISHINLNNAATPGADHKPNFGTIVPHHLAASPSKLSTTRKRDRPKPEKMDDHRFVRVNLGQSAAAAAGGGTDDGVNVNANANANNSSSNNNNSNVNVGPAIQGLIEETVRNSLSPMFKDLINNAINASGFGGGGGGGGIRGVGPFALNTMPLNFSGVNSGDVMMDEKWRNQQILELEVYSKRLELIQDQIKLTLDELRSMGG